MSKKSWIDSANEPDCGFPLESLPFCAFTTPNMERRLGVGIGDQVLDLNLLSHSGLLKRLPWVVRSGCRREYLNRLMGLSAEERKWLRERLTSVLSESCTAADRDKLRDCLRPMTETKFCLSVRIGDYTDFYASVHHATNVGKLFRPDQPLLPNYKWIPIGYHGRASSIVVSGSPVVRPSGQTKAPTADAPSFGQSRQVDYELELGVYVGPGNFLGNPIGINDAESHLFGVSLLNDWSARDIQAWEYQPLGPFLSKSFATSVSPWVVPMEALAPYRTPLAARADGDPEPLPYLSEANPASGIDVQLEVSIASAKMREAGMPPMRVSQVRASELYWSFAQMVAHHTVNGCNLRAGDLLATGTISGAQPGSEGCLLEMTRRGANPLDLPSGERRTFLEDFDQVTFTGFCAGEGLPRLSLGECNGMVVPATLSGRGV